MTETLAVQPDFRPASMFVSQRAYIEAAFAELNRRLAPARLANHSLNGSLLFANQNVAGSNPQNVGELADLLERAIKSVVYEGKLIWDVKPKTLVGPNNPAKQISAAESEEQFGKWQKDAEAKAKHDKEQAAAEKRVAALIAAFTPTKNGRLDYPLIEKVNARHRGWFEDAKKDGKDLLKVEEQIRRDQQVTYDRVERDSWKM